jgi:hypothetical protein
MGTIVTDDTDTEITTTLLIALQTASNNKCLLLLWSWNNRYVFFAPCCVGIFPHSCCQYLRMLCSVGRTSTDKHPLFYLPPYAALSVSLTQVICLLWKRSITSSNTACVSLLFNKKSELFVTSSACLNNFTIVPSTAEGTSLRVRFRVNLLLNFSVQNQLICSRKNRCWC